jgi:beta-glucuronidase
MKENGSQRIVSETHASLHAITRRKFVGYATAAAGAAMVEPGSSEALKPAVVSEQNTVRSVGLLKPQQNAFRNLIDLSGIWEFQIDPEGEGEAKGWPERPPKSRPIAVPCSWNDLFDDVRNYLDLAWYWKKVWLPSSWKAQRIYIRVGSANYAAKVWVNGKMAAEHLGGHLPFQADITKAVLWDRENTIAISVENKQSIDRVPPGAGEGGGGVAGVMAGFPLTTYDFFPYAGLHRPVILYSVPAQAHIGDITVVTSIDGADGLVNVKISATQNYSGEGRVQLDGQRMNLKFRDGNAEAVIRVQTADFWSPEAPRLYALTSFLNDGEMEFDSYSLEIGIRTLEVRGSELLLNGKPVKLRGFDKHEDFPLHGRGLNLPMWVRDFELLRWIGANSFRTSHYPYAEEAMSLADRLGMLVINEIPAVGLNFEDPGEDTDKRLQQCRLQIRELIARDKNHPSTIMWCVANEPMGGPLLGTGEPVASAVESGTKFFREMYQETKQLDPTRPVTMVGVQGGPREWHGIFDVVAINRYYGWYTHAGRLEEGSKALAQELDQLNQTFGKPIIIAEFGTDAIPGAHHLPAEMWTEEYQLEFIRGFLEVAAERPFVAGMHVWAFADFKTGQGTMRAKALNHKGVFTRDRRPKMAAHFLRTHWQSPERA